MKCVYQFLTSTLPKQFKLLAFQEKRKKHFFSKKVSMHEIQKQYKTFFLTSTIQIDCIVNVSTFFLSMLDWKVNLVTIYLSDVVIEFDKEYRYRLHQARLLLTLLKFLQSKIV